MDHSDTSIALSAARQRAVIAGWIQIFGDSADGDLKVRFPNGTIKTIQTN